MGGAAFRAPLFQEVRTLKGGSMKPLDGGSGRSKGFLISVGNRSGNDHLMFVSRIHGSSTSNTVTKTGRPRWRTRAGKVEKVYDIERIGGSSMERAIWHRGGDTRAAEYLDEFVQRRIGQLLDKAGGSQ